jgi:DegV family protein with EDD domain
MAVKLVTDSTSYLSEEIKNEFDISVVSLNVIIDGKSFREVDLDNNKFYQAMDNAEQIPTSSQPSVEEFSNAFKAIAKEGNDIVGVFLSSDMSGTYSTAHLIKEMVLEEYPNIKIEIVDSRTNCMQMGFQVLQGARAAKNGEDINSVVKIIKETEKTSKFLFVPDTLKYLKKGGRIGGAAALFGTILQIKPILTVEDGKTTVFEKVRTKRKAVDLIIDKVKSEILSKGLGEVVVHHINCEEEGLKIASRLEEELNTNVEVRSIGPTIGLHVGPNTVGVAYYTKINEGKK